MNIFQALILGIVQGLTEFLPISSSGHLALLQNYFQEINVGFDVIIHFATLLAILVFFFKDILQFIKGFFSFDWKNKDFRICIYLIIATIPIAADTEIKTLDALIKKYRIETLPAVIVNEDKVFRDLAAKEEILAEFN